MKKVITIFFLGLLFKLTAGQTHFWEQTNGPNSGPVFSIESYYPFIFAGSNDGIFRSSDYGQTWHKQLFSGFYILDFVKNDSVIYAATLNGVYYSKDYGVTWYSLNNGLSNLQVNCIDIDDSNNLFAGTRGGGVFFFQYGDSLWATRNAGLTNLYITCLSVNTDGIIVAGTDSSGLFRSTDNGFTWNPSNSGLKDRWTQAIAAGTNDTIYVASLGDIYRSLDKGLTWIRTNFDSSNLVLSLYAYENQNIFAGTIGGAFHSVDNGGTWNRISNISTVRAFHFTENRCILIGNDYDGLLASIDDGNSWSLVGLPQTQINLMLTLDNDLIFANDFETTLRRSSDKGNSWNSYHKYFNVPNLTSNDEEEIFAGSSEGIIKSTDKGNTWNILTNSIPGGAASILIESTDTIYAGSNALLGCDNCGGLYRSTDKGLNWTKIAFSNLTVAFLFKNLNENLFAGVGTLFYRSSDQGNSWEQLPVFDVTAMAAKSDGTLYAVSRSDGLFFSLDNGDTWNDVGLNGSNVKCLFISPNDDLFCGTEDEGLFFLGNLATAFTQLNSGLTSEGVLSFVMDKTGFLYAGSVDGGVYRSKNPITSVWGSQSSTPNMYLLYPNYPNPFNPATTIEFYIPQMSRVNLKIFDLLGNEVAELINEDKTAGRHKLIFDASILSSGIYFYQLRAGNFIQTKKMILIK